MASNYDMSKLTAGQIIAFGVAVCALGAAIPTLKRSFVSCLPFLTITIAYGIMMFASSYVEEEQHFWYWTTSGWLCLLSFKGYDGCIASMLF
jgi:ethanolamine phosphate transferase 2 subunit G